jgi:glycosyltransferase involved in cell wall biosynthesis
VRVVYLSHFAGLGGAERSLLELLRAVRGRVEPLLVCPPGPLAAEAAAAGIPVASWCACVITRSRGANSWRRTIPRVVRGWTQLNRIVRQFRPDVIHVNSAQAMLWNGPVSWWRGCPVIWHWRDFYDFRRLSRLMAGRADAIVAISDAMLAFAAGQLAPARPRLVLVRNGIADISTQPATTASDGPLIVMAGQSVPRKGHTVLLEAMVRLARTHRGVRARLVCAEHDAEGVAHTRRLREQAKALGCAHNVEITGGVDDLAPLLRGADIVAVPSLREPFGRIAVEAMLAERPVVASDVDGLREIVTDGESGLLVPAGDAGQLAAALARMLDEPRIWSERGRAARQTALRRFSIDRVASEVVSLYGSLQ